MNKIVYNHAFFDVFLRIIIKKKPLAVSTIPPKIKALKTRSRPIRPNGFLKKFHFLHRLGAF